MLGGVANSYLKRNDILTWSIYDVIDWLGTMNLRDYEDHFRKHHIDGSVLLELNEDNLRHSLKMEKSQDRSRFLRGLRMLKNMGKY